MDVTTNSCIFFLGGHDLEMLEIKKILLANNFTIIDKNLAWGAKLSHYQDDFSKTKTNVCIELTEDILPPSKYLRIDHHNELSHLPASIEQLAALLHIQLTQHQQLVAANDKGYIPAMQAMGASEAEIQSIRLLDRKAQGVSEADERLAEESIAQHLTVAQGVTVVKSLTHKFSPIADRLFGKTNNRLLVYTNTELNYYGEKANIVANFFNKLIKQNRAYSGGGVTGFFGFNGKDADEIMLVKKQILRILTAKLHGNDYRTNPS